jgi:hypothetical protein
MRMGPLDQRKACLDIQLDAVSCIEVDEPPVEAGKSLGSDHRPLTKRVCQTL